MVSCPICLAELHPDAGAALADAFAEGRPAHRAAGERPFSRHAPVTVRRLHANSALVYLTAGLLIEANVVERRRGFDCVDIAGPTLFGLRHYDALEDPALVATDADGDPLAVFVMRTDAGRRLDVRDETSAPCARLEPRPGGFDLIETGGGRLAACDPEDIVYDDGWVDDSWTLTPIDEKPSPLQPFALLALPLAAKALLGRREPEARPVAKP
jgi:hypothetical protein